MNKLFGILMIVLPFIIAPFNDGDITVGLVTIPLGIGLIGGKIKLD